MMRGQVLSRDLWKIIYRVDEIDHRLEALEAKMEKPTPTFTTAFGSSKPEGVYVKPGDRVQWIGEDVVIDNHLHTDADRLFVWVCRNGQMICYSPRLSDLAVRGKPVLGLERER
jgi:hypothetical protein